LEQYRVKHGKLALGTFSSNRSYIAPELKQAHALFYQPYTDLEGTSRSSHPIRYTRIAEIESALKDQNWYSARQKSAELINATLEGLRYLQTYVLPVFPSFVLMPLDLVIF